MDKLMMNKLDDKEMELDNMEMDKVSGGIMPYPRPRPRPRCHDSNANSMEAYPYAGQAETDHADCHP